MYRGLCLENERYAWIFLNRIPFLGPARFHKLLLMARSALGILELPVSGLMLADVPESVAEQWHREFRSPLNHHWLEQELNRLSKGVYHVLTELDEAYPSSLRELSGRPPVLYYKGRWPLPEKAVALVGSRHPSSYGKSVAERFAIDLTHQGIATVSGLAQGIDTCVHQSTLQAGGFTVAVLGCGLGHVFPAENKALQAEISEAGIVISEFPYDRRPDAPHFPRRNRIISGLASGVVVIEAQVKSGALITARYAGEQGRDVFAVPGPIHQSTSSGCHKLIQQGARLVESASDILEELRWVENKKDAFTVDKTDMDFGTLSPLEKRIAQLLSDQPLSVDEITLSTSLRFEQVADSLLSLELKGIIRALPGQRYAKSER
jgi:DNA processing protein